MTNQAVRIIRQRTRDSQNYTRLRQLILDWSADTCHPPTVSNMRELGGFSAVLRHQIEGQASAVFNEDFGSKLWPWTIKDELRSQIETELRFELQMTVSQVQPSWR